MAGETVASGTTVTSQATPTWYDQLSKSFADTLATGVENVGRLTGGTPQYITDQLQLPMYLQVEGQQNGPEIGDTFNNLRYDGKGWHDPTKNTSNWYQGPLVQGLDPLQQGAITSAGGAANTWQPGLTAAGQTLGTAAGQAQTASNFNPANFQQFMNPYLQGAQQSTMNLSNRNLFENVIPKVNSTFAGTGQFGSSRNADFMNNAIRNQQDTLTNSLGQLNYGAASDALKNQYQWGQLGTQGAQVMGALGQAQQGLGSATADNTWTDLLKQLQIGGVGQAQGQRELDASYADWQKQLTLPMELMQAMSGQMPNIAGLYKGNQVQVNAPNTAQQGGLEQLLAVILSGYGSGSGA